VGGFVISAETAIAWASRLKGRELHLPRDSPSIWKVIFDKVRLHHANFLDVGEELGVDYMIITQSARFQGYKDMDPALIPRFEEGEREVTARQLLEEEGVSRFGTNGNSDS
jgi:hypothetical protein